MTSFLVFPAMYINFVDTDGCIVFYYCYKHIVPCKDNIVQPLLLAVKMVFFLHV